jgi:FixJ family two-component response regulator
LTAGSEIEALKKALAELPERAREALRRMSIEGKTAQQVAEELEVSVRTGKQSDNQVQDPTSRYQVIGVGELTDDQAKQLTEQRRLEVGR